MKAPRNNAKMTLFNKKKLDSFTICRGLRVDTLRTKIVVDKNQSKSVPFIHRQTSQLYTWKLKVQTKRMFFAKLIVLRLSFSFRRNKVHKEWSLHCRTIRSEEKNLA